MPVLCIDTAAATPVVVLLGATPNDDRGGVGTGRAQDLLQLVDSLLDGIDRSSIEAVVVGVGPGGFTGLRVGVATARGIAETLGVPLHPVPSLLALVALDARAVPGEVVWAVLDARRGERFVQPFVADADGRVAAVDAMRAVAADELDALLGAARRTIAPVASPASLASAARQVLAEAPAAGTGNPLTVLPAYGREPDAEPPRMDVRIDQLGDEDLDALLVLEARCFPTPWSRAMYAEELHRPPADRVQLAARDAGANGRLVGAALAARIGDGWHVLNVLVDPIARRRGIAARLVEELVEQTRRLGVAEGWTLEVRDANAAAIQLYERHGFAVVGRRPGYYADTGEDALVMWRYVAEPAAASLGGGA